MTSLGQFLAACRPLQEDPGTGAIHSIHIAGELSGADGSAVVAAGQMPEEPPITTFGSRSGSMGLGFTVLKAAEMAGPGLVTRIFDGESSWRIHYPQ